MQTVIAQINHAIGASGVVSQECKAVVGQYGQTIMDLLLAEVKKMYFKELFTFFSYITKKFIDLWNLI